jgi:hypothetical protein
MTASDLLLAYVATGCSVSGISLARMLCHQRSIDHVVHAARRSGLPLWVAAMVASVSLLVVAFEYAVLWPIRWREALR